MSHAALPELAELPPPAGAPGPGRVSAAVRATFESLEVRNFRLFFIGQLVSQVGTWLTTVALTLLVLHLTDRGVAIGALAACQFGPLLVLGAWAGVIADRSDKRRLLLVTQALEMIQSFALAGLAFMHHPPLPALYLTALAGGFMLAFDNPARRSFVPEMVPAERVQNAVTLNSALMTSSRIFGPALAGILAVTVGYGWCFTVDAVSYVAVLVALAMMRTEDLERSPVAARAKGQVRAGLRYVRAIPDLWVPLTMTAVIGTLTFNFAVVLPLFVERTLHGDDAGYTVLYSVLSVGSFAGALVAAHRRTTELRHVVASALAFGIAMVVFAASPTLVLAFPVGIAVGFTSVAFLTTSTALMQVRADPSMRGRVVALQAAVLIGSTPIGGPLLGLISDDFGVRYGLLLGGVAALAAAAWGRLADRRPVPARAGEPLEIVVEAAAQ